MLKARFCDYRLLNNLQQMHLKLLQKEQLKKEQKQSSVRLAKKLIIKFQKNQKSETVRNETKTVRCDSEIPKEGYLSPKDSYSSYINHKHGSCGCIP